MDIAAGASVQHGATVRVGTRHMPTYHLESNVGVGIWHGHTGAGWLTQL